MTPVQRALQLCLAVAIALGLTLPMTGTTSSAAAQETGDREEMGTYHAGVYYLRGACTATKVEKRFSWRIWLGRDSIRMAEVQRRLPEIKRHTGDLVKGMEDWIEHLNKPPAAWPKEVRTPVKRLAFHTGRYTSLLERAARAGSAREWGKWLRASRNYDFPSAAQTIRKRLDLPPSGGCNLL